MKPDCAVQGEVTALEVRNRFKWRRYEETMADIKWCFGKKGETQDSLRMTLPRSSVTKSRPSAPARLQRRRMLSRIQVDAKNNAEITAGEVETGRPSPQKP